MPENPQIPSEWTQPGAAPLEVDFGCHRGTFLLGMAEKYAGINFLGIEKQAARVEKCLRKIHRKNLSNALAVQGEGTEALAGLLPDQSVSILHISFPDPWPKRRHANRRLIDERFLQESSRVLCAGGILRLMTDDAAYFHGVKRLLKTDWEEVDWQDGTERPVTAFEKNFLELGLRPNCCAIRPVSRR